MTARTFLIAALGFAAACSLDDGLGPIEAPPTAGAPVLTLITPVDGALFGVIDDADAATQELDLAVSFSSDIDTEVALFLDDAEIGVYAIDGGQEKVVTFPIRHGHRKISVRPAASGDTVSAVVQVDAQRPAAPTLGAILPTHARTVELTWTEPDDADDVGSDAIVGYSLYLDGQAQDVIIPASSPGDQKSYVLLARPSLGVFTVDLHAIDDADNVSTSVTLTVPPAFVLGTDEGASFTGAGCSGDFNGDELRDFALQHRSENGDRRLLIYQGSAIGNLIETTITDPDETFGKACAAGDLDGDGDDELIVARANTLTFVDGRPGGVSFNGYYMDLVYFYDEDSVSSFGETLSVGPSLFAPTGLSVAVTTGSYSPAVTMFPEGSVNATSSQWHSAFGNLKTHARATLARPDNGQGVRRIAKVIAGDLDGDGQGDLVSLAIDTGFQSTKLAIVIGPVAPTATLELEGNAALTVTPPAGGRFAEHLLLADGDGDGSAEVITIVEANNTFELFTYRHGGGGEIESLPGDGAPQHLVACDLMPAAGDELVLALGSGGSHDLYMRVGGAWILWQRASRYDGLHCLGDVDGDGRNDLAIISGADGRLTVAF